MDVDASSNSLKRCSSAPQINNILPVPPTICPVTQANTTISMRYEKFVLLMLLPLYYRMKFRTIGI